MSKAAYPKILNTSYRSSRRPRKSPFDTEMKYDEADELDHPTHPQFNTDDGMVNSDW